jgi:hypothetical protein
MRLYVAASWPRRELAEWLASRLIAAGHTVTSLWHSGPGGDYASKGGPAKVAEMDMADLLRAEALVCLTGDTLTHGGRHGEVGAAIATMRPVYLLGPREACVWHHHPRVYQFDDVKALLQHLRGVDIITGRGHE